VSYAVTFETLRPDTLLALFYSIRLRYAFRLLGLRLLFLYACPGVETLN